MNEQTAKRTEPKAKVGKPLPKTDREWALYRAQLNCKVAKDELTGEKKRAVDPVLYSLLCLTNAIEDIALALTLKPDYEKTSKKGTKSNG